MNRGIYAARIIVYAAMLTAILDCLISDEDMASGLRVICVLSIAAAVAGAFGIVL